LLAQVHVEALNEPGSVAVAQRPHAGAATMARPASPAASVATYDLRGRCVPRGTGASPRVHMPTGRW
jgi:hypothetical protein